jgi:hypothetical protein
MHHPLEAIAAGFLIVGAVLNVVLVVRSPDSDHALSWRTKWTTQTRRNPLLRSAALACLLLAAALFIANAVTNRS